MPKIGKNISRKKVRRLKRPMRLRIAREWITYYKGKNIADAYRRHFQVDWFCTFKELELLRVEVDPEFKKGVLRAVNERITARQIRKEIREGRLAPVTDCDDTFAFIAGYTEGGAPFGVTWEEWEREKKATTICDDREFVDFDYEYHREDPGDIPF
jgi:hypothetical protein